MDINENVYQIKDDVKAINRQHRHRLFFVLISGALMMTLLLLTDLFIYDIVYPVGDFIFSVFGLSKDNPAAQEVVLIAIQMVVYLVTMILPVVIPAALYLKRSPVEYKGSKGVPMYIPFIIGCSYITSLIANLLFSGCGDRFGGSVADSVPTTIPGIIMYLLFLSLMPGILEELAFRGVMLRVLSPFGEWQAIIISAIIFGSMHINPPQALFAFTFGLLAGWLYMKTGTLLWGTLVHLTVNGISGIASILLNYYDELSPEVMSVSLVTMSFICFAIVYGIYLSVNRNKNKEHFTPSEIPDVTYVKPSTALGGLFKGFCLPATALYVALYITLLLARYFPETVDIILGIA